MTTRLSPDDIQNAIEALKPDADTLGNAWYIGLRENTLQSVLARAKASPEPATTHQAKPRRRRRTVLIGTLAVVMLGGGTAWAYSNFTSWYTGGALDSYTCMTTWHDPDTSDNRPDQYGGSKLTNDPVADCATYAGLTGKGRIVDPVAVTYRDALVVGPREGMPADAVPIVVLEDAKAMELQQSFDDYVDGGASRCLDATTGEQFAHAELLRLGLAGWTVTSVEQRPSGGECAILIVDQLGKVEVRTHFGVDAGRDVPDLVATLRNKIADQCLALPDAEKVVASALEGQQHYQATSAQLDPAAPCTRVDLNVGGSLQVFLHGPATATGRAHGAGASPEPNVTTTEPRTTFGPLTGLLRTREHAAPDLHNAQELVIAQCMAKQGFTYIPRPYPGILRQDPAELAGLNKQRVEDWNAALQGKSIDPVDMTKPGPITDPTIVVLEIPGGRKYFRNNTCRYAGEAAVFGDAVNWLTLDATISYLSQQAAETAAKDPRWGAQPDQVLSEIETRIAATNQSSIERYNQLQDRALSNARELLTHGR